MPEEHTGTITTQQLEVIMDKILKDNRQDVEAWQKRILAEHENNFIMVDGYTAVIDIGVNTLASWDGCNGYYELKADDYVQWKRTIDPSFAATNEHYTTKQGLDKIYRFPVMINDMAEPNDYNVTIVADKDIPTGARRLFTAANEIEMQQRRM